MLTTFAASAASTNYVPVKNIHIPENTRLGYKTPMPLIRCCISKTLRPTREIFNLLPVSISHNQLLDKLVDVIPALLDNECNIIQPVYVMGNTYTFQLFNRPYARADTTVGGDGGMVISIDVIQCLMHKDNMVIKTPKTTRIVRLDYRIQIVDL